MNEHPEENIFDYWNTLTFLDRGWGKGVSGYLISNIIAKQEDLKVEKRNNKKDLRIVIGKVVIWIWFGNWNALPFLILGLLIYFELETGWV